MGMRLPHPKVWRTTTPEAATAARQMGCTKALRRILGDRIDSPGFARAAELLIKAATSPPPRGSTYVRRAPRDPGPRRRGDPCLLCSLLAGRAPWRRHIAALMAEGVGGIEAHVLLALDINMPPATFGHIHHLPAAQLAALIHGMRDRGLIGDDGWLSERGHAVTASRGAQRRPRGEALREPRPGRAC